MIPPSGSASSRARGADAGNLGDGLESLNSRITSEIS
jgi:hypothetical protein